MAWANSALRGNDLVSNTAGRWQILRSLAPPSRNSLDCIGNAIDLFFCIVIYIPHECNRPGNRHATDGTGTTEVPALWGNMEGRIHPLYTHMWASRGNPSCQPD